MAVRTAALLSVLLLVAAASPADRLAPVGRGRVVAVVDGDTLDLEDGRRVRLAGIEAARPPPGREQERRWPLAEAAARALADLAHGRTVDLRGTGVEDRHGRLLVHAVRDDGVWLQGELLRRGHARVLTRPDARDLVAEMLAAEAEARAARRGIWGTRAYAVRGADDLERLRRDRDSIQVVEGLVLAASRVKGQVYLNFGEDWRSDFSVHIGRDALKLFSRAGIDPPALEGATVRVRGWLTQRNGPMIDVTHPEQIEVIAAGGRLSAPTRSPSGRKRDAVRPPRPATDDHDPGEEDSE